MELTTESKKIKDGEVLKIPTDTVDAYVAKIFDKKAVQKIFELKKRALEKNLPVFVSSVDEIKEFAEFDPRYSRIIQKFWPGPLTLILPIKPEIDLFLGTNPQPTVAVRFPNSELIKSLIESNGPLAQTSANLSGELPHASNDKRGVDFEPEVSTIITIENSQLKLIRAGKISFEDISTIGFS